MLAGRKTALNATTEKRDRILTALGQHRGEHATAQLVAADLMTESPECIDESTTLLEMVELFYSYGFRHFIVTDPNDRLVGVISDRDVIGCLGPDGKADCQAFAEVPARQLMSTELVTIGPDSPIHQAVDLMVDHSISCLPVLSQGEVVGIVTNTDLNLLLQLVLQSTKLSLLEEPTAPAATNR